MKNFFYLFLLLMPFMAFAQRADLNFETLGSPATISWHDASIWTPNDVPGIGGDNYSVYINTGGIFSSSVVEFIESTQDVKVEDFTVKGDHKGELILKSSKFTVTGDLDISLPSPATFQIKDGGSSSEIVFEKPLTLLGSFVIDALKSNIVFGTKGNNSDVLVFSGVATEANFGSVVVHGNFVADLNPPLGVSIECSDKFEINGNFIFKDDVGNIDLKECNLFTCKKFESNQGLDLIDWGKNTKVIVEHFDSDKGTNPKLNVTDEVYTEIKVSTDGKTITIPYEHEPCEPEYNDAGDLRTKKDEFKVFADGVPVSVQSISRNANSYVLKLSKVIGQGQKVKLSYEGGIVPKYDNIDTDQRAVANIPKGEITNSSTVELPTLTKATLTISDDMQEIEFDFSQQMQVVSGATVNWGNFKIKAGGETKTLTSVFSTTASFKEIEFEIDTIYIPWLIQHKDDLRLSYEGNWLENATSAKLAHFSDKEVKLIDNTTKVKPTNAVISENGTKIQVHFSGDGLKSHQSIGADCFELRLKEKGESIKILTISNVSVDNSGNLWFTLNDSHAIPKDTLIETLNLSYTPSNNCGIISDKGVKIDGFTIGTGNTVTFHNNSQVGDVFYVNGTAKITFDGKYVLLTCDVPVKVQDGFQNNEGDWFLVSKKRGSDKSYVKVVAITLHPYDDKTVVLHLERPVPESEGDLFLAPYKERRADGPIVSLGGKPLRDWGNWILLERGEGVNPPAVPLSPIGIVSIFGLIALIGFIRYRR